LFGNTNRRRVKMEEEMRLSKNMNAKATLACGFVLTALALATPNSVAYAGSASPVSRHLSLHHRSVDPRTSAEVPATPALFTLPFFGESYAPAPRKPETDGLSRDRDDCVKYGCIDSGG
jgi:hypothetical protein